MSRTISPTLVSQYSLKLIDKGVLEKKLKELASLAENNDEFEKE